MPATLSARPSGHWPDLVQPAFTHAAMHEPRHCQTVGSLPAPCEPSLRYKLCLATWAVTSYRQTLFKNQSNYSEVRFISLSLTRSSSPPAAELSDRNSHPVLTAYVIAIYVARIKFTPMADELGDQLKTVVPALPCSHASIVSIYT